MHVLEGRGLYAFVLMLALIVARPVAARAADATVKVAFWNIMSGRGADALPGHPRPFVNTPNCTDPTQALNAWGTGAAQAALTLAMSDPGIVALGLAEAWPCATPMAVRTALGWKTSTSDHNGVALIARYGIVGAEQWQQLDTTLNPNPADTMWVLRVMVCLEATCAQTMPVYVTHWYAEGVSETASYIRQAQQTVSFLSATSSGLPHVIIGDFNVFEGTAVVCAKLPNNSVLPYLRDAGYRDAWMAVHGGAEGFTGMVNRAGCGVPEGYPWKRIDDAWTLPAFPAVDMQRFAMTPPGDASPSDHYGIIVTLPHPFAASAPAPAPVPPPAPAPPSAPAPAPVFSEGEIVLYAKNAAVIAGAWTVTADPAAAGGVRLATADAGAPKLPTASATPVNYFELPFKPIAGRAYRLWIRGEAVEDSYQNDSAFVQFSGSVAADGGPAFRIGTTAATVVSIEEGSGKGLAGWGWQDNGYGTDGVPIYFDSTAQTLRVQSREDGLSIDQIVLSPVRFLTAAPGAAKNDATILPESPAPAGAPDDEVVLYAKNATVVTGAWTAVSDATAAQGTRLATPDLSVPKIAVAAAAPVSFFELPFVPKAGRAYRLWIRGKAADDSYQNDSAFAQFSGSVAPDGSPIFRIGTTSATVVSIEEGAGKGLDGWGWQDNGYGGDGPLIYFDGSPQKLRIQIREDGMSIDQIVLSSVRYATAAPGAAKNDTTILPVR